jgi:hypothetical protein
MVCQFGIFTDYGVIMSCADDLRRMMVNPRNPPSLRNDSWNFGGKVTLMKAADHFLEKMIHGLVREPAMDDSDMPKYPGNIIGILRKVIETTRLHSVQNCAINHLRIVADHGWFAFCC